MKKRVIGALIAKKFEDWVATIDDEAVKTLVKENSICTGGALASMLRDEKPNDYDFYFRNLETTLAVANYYVNRFKLATNNETPKDECGSIVVMVSPAKDRVTIKVKSKGVASEDNPDGYEYFELTPEDRTRMADFVGRVTEATKTNGNGEEAEKDKGKPKYRPVFLSRNAITLSQGVQLVLRFFGEAEDIHKNYDFVHCTNYWTSWTRQVTLRPEAIEALLAHELRYVGSKYPLCSLFRVKKFVERGWKCNAGTILKIAWNLQEYNLKDIGVLEEQLTGVDVAYFMELIEKLRERDPDKVDGTYLAELIDKMF